VAASEGEVGTSTSAVIFRFYGYAEFMSFTSIDELETALSQSSYLTDRGLATALFLALKLEKPLLLEGEAGVGKS